ncbi:MAG: hypothetical protein WC491_08130 [Candidatus Omnitrophota bacterium]
MKKLPMKKLLGILALACAYVVLFWVLPWRLGGILMVLTLHGIFAGSAIFAAIVVWAFF